MSNLMFGGHDEELEGCRDDSYALFLKMIAIAAILTAGICGVSTGFGQMLITRCRISIKRLLPTEFPWSKFPFSGFIAMMAALATLLADFVGSRYYERKQEKQSQNVQADLSDTVSESGIVPVETRRWNGRVFGEEEGGAIHIVGMHVDAAHYVHSRLHEQGECERHMRELSHGHSHSHRIVHGDEEVEVKCIVVFTGSGTGDSITLHDHWTVGSEFHIAHAQLSL